MTTASINNPRYLQSLLATALQGTSLATNSKGNNLNGVTTSSSDLQPDSSQLSPFARLLSALQQLQQSDPGKYQQVTQQIATNLQNAAQTAESQGNTSVANQLNQLATDFTNASQSGQLPNIQDLAQALQGHSHHHHFHVLPRPIRAAVPAPPAVRPPPQPQAQQAPARARPLPARALLAHPARALLAHPARALLARPARPVRAARPGRTARASSWTRFCRHSRPMKPRTTRTIRW